MKLPARSAAGQSLRRRLLLMVSMFMLLIWVLAGAMSYRQARIEVREMLDIQMAQTASLLLAQASHWPEQVDLDQSMKTQRGAGKSRTALALEFLLMRGDGSILSRTARAPSLPLADSPGYADLLHAGESWRSLVLTTASGDYRIQVMQSLRSRDKEALEIAFKMLKPIGLLIPVLLVLIYFSVRRGLEPLDNLAAQVAARSSENLQALNSSATPAETRPLVLALNRLLERLGTSLDNERRFTADAAHELRTPLAAVRVQAQVALACNEPEERQHALNQVVAGTGRATRLVEQLLSLARLDPLARLPEAEAVDLVVLAQKAIEASKTNASQRQNDMHLDVPDEALIVDGNEDLLAIALRNLIENAQRYTPPGCPITVFACRADRETLLGVRDAGAGVSPEQLPRLFQRFYRGNDITTEGTGLGLAIVQRIAELHAAHLEADNVASGGFRVQLRWDLPSSD